ncbi:hypothetical protein [Campylobacter geochelonis]|uniref:DUF8095 domain-containing protein n=1 Tax=Campylobacter geochelonis TaxID=1780362 RepID=A0A128EJN3_9BACT|nr:hypothetical protein [Campylobacter geochelonis]QKF71539.1 hypothetical protein CGEO_1242 [Campylobacter geochelonis]CZE48791.1 Uncharacterised protein [Campylobacter geochelonis]CZE49074.1 Uncharacterised protein [Campylobacter geochelonis]
MKTRILLTILSILVFTGCGLSPSLDDSDDKYWQKYLENDAKVQEISFMLSASTKDLKKTEIGDYLGYADIKNVRPNGIYTREKIGEIYSFGVDNQSLIIINLNNNKSMNFNDKSDIDTMKTLKKIKFYAIGGGMIETIVYSAKEPVCKVFNEGKKVDARSVTNYYLGDEEDMFATIINAKIGQNENEIKSLKYEFFINERDLEDIKKSATSKDFKNDVIEKDILKQRRILENILCLK